MQKTNFKFELLIHDDASTDGTNKIIEEYEKAYPDVVKPIYQTENQFSQGISIGPKYLYPRAQGKYIAECEGDDYWTDSLKLQKQVDILESDPSLVAVATNSEIVDKDGNQIHSMIESVVSGNVEGRYNLRDFVHHHHSYPTASVLFRNIHSEEYDRMIAVTRNPYYSDWIQWFILHLFGDFYYLNEVTTAYRINPDSVTHRNTNERRLGVAKENFKKYDSNNKITLLEGDATEILKTLSQGYDFIFMDAAKAQYINFLPECLRILNKGGLLVSDNVLQDGDVIESRFAVTRRDRTIHARMREYLYELKHNDALNTVILTVGDGMALSVKL